MGPVTTGLRLDVLRALHSLGWAGRVGLALLLLCGPVAGWWLPSASAGVQVIADAADASRRQALRAQTTTTATTGNSPGVAPFGQSFPGLATRSARLTALLAAAERHRVQVGRSEYRYSTDATLALGHYRVVLPVTAGYAGLQAFIADALRQDGALALERLSIAREAADGGTLRAELVFALYVHHDTGGASRAQVLAGRP